MHPGELGDEAEALQEAVRGLVAFVDGSPMWDETARHARIVLRALKVQEMNVQAVNVQIERLLEAVETWEEGR